MVAPADVENVQKTKCNQTWKIWQFLICPLVKVYSGISAGPDRENMFLQIGMAKPRQALPQFFPSFDIARPDQALPGPANPCKVFPKHCKEWQGKAKPGRVASQKILPIRPARSRT